MNRNFAHTAGWPISSAAGIPVRCRLLAYLLRMPAWSRAVAAARSLLPVGASRSVERTGRLGPLVPMAWSAAFFVWLYDFTFSARHPGSDGTIILAGVHRFVHHQPVYEAVAAGNTFNHFPSELLLLSPLAAIPTRAALTVILMLSVLFFVAALLSLARGRWYAALFVLAAGLAAPVTAELSEQNVDLLAAGLVGLALAAERRHARWTWLTLGLALKPTVWPVAFAFGVPGLLALCAVAALNGVALLLVSHADRFFTGVLPFLSHGQASIEHVARASIADALRELHAPNGLAIGIATVLLVGSVVYLIRTTWPATRQAAPLLIIASLLFASYTFAIYAVYVIVVAPILRIRSELPDLVIAGAAAYLIGTNDSWGTSSAPAARYVVAIGALFVLGLRALHPGAESADPA
jgi:hypothetical protein